MQVADANSRFSVNRKRLDNWIYLHKYEFFKYTYEVNN